jgi:arsenite-transporting ATPase
MQRMANGLAKRIFTLAWLTVPPIGFVELSKLVVKPLHAEATHA